MNDDNEKHEKKILNMALGNNENKSMQSLLIYSDEIYSIVIKFT